MQSPFLKVYVPSCFGSKCGSDGWSLMPTMGDSPPQSSPSSSKRFRMNCASSYSVSFRFSAKRLADLGEGLVLDVLDLVAGLEMALVALLVDERLELLDEVGGRDDLVPEAPDDLDRSRVDDRHVRNIVERRILHGELLRLAEHLLDGRVELSPGAVESLLAGERVEPRGLDRGDEADRLPLRRNEVEPAPRRHLLEIETEHAVREMIAVVEIAQQPAVDALFLESSLNLLDVHRPSLPVFESTQQRR